MIGTETASEQVKQAFDFTVDKRPLFAVDQFASIDNDGNPISEELETGFYGLFRSDNNSIVGGASVSDRYNPHQTADIVALVDAASQAFEGPQVECGFNNGHIVNLIPSDDHRRAIYGTKDNIFPRLIITAGYDGNAFKASLGLYRDTCKNLELISTMKETTRSIRHSASLQDKVDDLAVTFHELASKWNGVADTMQKLQETPVKFTDFLDAVYPIKENESQKSETMRVNRTEAIFNRLRRERYQTGRPAIDSSFTVSAYEAYQVVQGYAMHDQTRRGRPSQLDRALLASNDKAVVKAEQLVMELV